MPWALRMPWKNFKCQQNVQFSAIDFGFVVVFFIFIFPVEFLNKSEWIIVHLLVHFRVRSVQKSFSHTCTCCWLSCLSLSALLTMHILIALLSITRPLAYFRILTQYFAKKYTHSCTIHLCACVCAFTWKQIRKCNDRAFIYYTL